MSTTVISFSARAPVPEPGTSGGPGLLYPACMVVQAGLGLLLPGSRQQTKIKGGDERGGPSEPLQGV